MVSPFSAPALRVMREGGILAPGEAPEQMIERTLGAVFAAEPGFGVEPARTAVAREAFLDAVERKLVLLGTPMLTNAGRGHRRPLGSCVAAPIDLRQPFATVSPLIGEHYAQNMGSGFDLDPVDDPVAIVESLDRHARRLSASCDRYVGNLANIGIDHPAIREFVTRKANGSPIPHLNLSVDVGGAFMAVLGHGGTFTLRDGSSLPADLLWKEIAQAAWECGDPGLLFLERFNRDNPTPEVGAYTTSAPCAEVGLSPGESCVFGYLNVAAFRTGGHLDLDLLDRVTRLLTRVLDNALETGLAHYPCATSTSVMSAKRKVGIGICGFADLLVALDLPYGDARARAVLRDLLLTITFSSKLASVELAEQRGSFKAFPRSRYARCPDFLSRKFGPVESGALTAADWRQLERRIRDTGNLRNASTTALPPSGRTSVLLGASASFEPWFSLLDGEGAPKDGLRALVGRHTPDDGLLARIAAAGTCQLPDVPETVREVARCAVEIAPIDHVLMAAAATSCVDEGGSKTVNLAAGVGIEEVAGVFEEAWRHGLKAISVYRDGSMAGQPERLGGGHVPE